MVALVLLIAREEIPVNLSWIPQHQAAHPIGELRLTREARGRVRPNPRTPVSYTERKLWLGLVGGHQNASTRCCPFPLICFPVVRTCEYGRSANLQQRGASHIGSLSLDPMSRSSDVEPLPSPHSDIMSSNRKPSSFPAACSQGRRERPLAPLHSCTGHTGHNIVPRSLGPPDVPMPLQLPRRMPRTAALEPKAPQLENVLKMPGGPLALKFEFRNLLPLC